MQKKKNGSRTNTTICREGVYYLVSVLIVFSAAILRQVNPMLLFASLLICPLFLAWRMGRRTLFQLTIQRQTPARVHAGDTFVVQVELINPRTKYSSWSIVAEDHIETVTSFLGQNQPAQHPAVYFEYAEPGEYRRKNYIGRLPHRGLYRFRQLTLSTRFPCGFFQSAKRIGESAELLVLPRIGKLSASWLTRQHEAVENQHRRRYIPSRVSGEFLGVRHWQHGDAKRWIHWRKSAKLDKLVVKQFEQHQNRDTAILLDLFRTNSGDDLFPATVRKYQENVELAVSFTATLAAEVIRRGGCNLLFGTYNKKYEILHGPAATPLLEQIFDRLAVLETPSQDCLAGMLLEMLTAIEPNTDLILVTHQPLKLDDMSRFGSLRDDPRLRVLAQRLRIVDTSSEHFSDIFEV
ncbi:MAG: DUF58 domain-containing protein [Planctomycetaceae bacterium]|jgi:uncharacterized protein (DUF58 family)|nr:DUF58 domain-containing protein [Planctomycetaceae bacterium]